MKHQVPKHYNKQKMKWGTLLTTFGRPKSGEKGYILFLTLLVISILLAVSLGLYSMTMREVTLSSFLRDSEKALAAAARGVECALYWDRSYPQNNMPYTIFATGTAYTIPINLDDDAVCHNGQSDIHLSSVSDTNWSVTTTAVDGVTTFSLRFLDGTCVDVTVTKVGAESTTIISDGYNSCNVALPRRTQRELAVFTNI